MRKQDYLVSLIRSLSPNEQRYFTLFSNIQAGEKSYMKLYEALLDKEEYDAGLLSKELGLTKGQLAEKKHYLTHNLFLSLQQAKKETPGSAARHQVDAARLLLERRQFDYALSITEKALAKAWETENFEEIRQLLRLKMLCLRAMQLDFDTAALMEEYNKVKTAADEFFEIELLSVDINRVEISRADAGKVPKMLELPLIKNGVEKLHSLKAQIEWFDIMIRYSMSIRDFESMRRLAQQEVDHYRRHPQVKSLDPTAYVVRFSRLANGESECNNLQAALGHIRQFEQALNDKSLAIVPVRIESMKYYADMFSAYVLRRMDRLDEALALYKKCYARRASRPVSEQYSTIYEYALVLFNQGKVAEAEIKLKELMDIKDKVRLDLHLLSKLLYIMIEAEQASYSLIPHSIKSLKLWMKNNSSEFREVIDLFCSQLLQIAKAPVLQRAEEWQTLKKMIDKGDFEIIDASLSLKPWVNRNAAYKRSSA